VLSHRVDRFLASRGIAVPPSSSVPTASPSAGTGGRPAEFVCEEDVREAVRRGVKIVIDSRSIVTPSARDLGDAKSVFVDAR
jgi:hypothetical protein